MHIELTELLRCPEPHEDALLVLSTGEMAGRMIVSGVVGCPICRREYEIVKGIVHFAGSGKRETASATFPVSRFPHADYPAAIQALLDLSGPGGFVVLVGSAARLAVGLAALMGGIHFVGVNAPADVEELPVLSLLVAAGLIPLRAGVARGVVVAADHATPAWIAEARRVLLRGRRLVIENEAVSPEGVNRLAAGQGLWVGAKS